MAKILPLTKKERRNVTLLSEAMSEAIHVLGGQARVKEVVAFVQKHYAFRAWSPKTMRSYFYYMSKPQRFIRVERAVYKNAFSVSKGNASRPKKKAA